MQEGRRKPCSDRVDLRALSPLYMAPICGTVTWLSSTNSRASSGRYSNSVGGGFLTAPGQIARIVFNPVAASCRLDHLKIEGRALFKPLGFEQAAGAFKFGQPVFQFFLDVLRSLLQRRFRRHVMRVRENPYAFKFSRFLPREWIKSRDGFNFIAKERDPQALSSRWAGKISTTSPRTLKQPR